MGAQDTKTLRADTLFVGVVVALLASLLLVLNPEPASAAKDQGRLTPIVVAPVPQKKILPVRGSDGRWHVMYELQLTNTLAGPATLRSAAVVNADNGRALLSLTAEEMISGEYLHTLNRTSAETTEFASNEARVLILNLSFPSKKEVPAEVVHRFEAEGADPFSQPATVGDVEADASNQQPSVFGYQAGRVRFSQDAAPVLSPPLEGDGWLASNAPPGPTSHVTAIVGLDGKPQATERWAADWIKVDPSGRAYTGERTNPESWFGYGAKVKAAAPGVVTAVRDGEPNQTAGTMPADLTFEQLPGNYVAIKMKGGFTAAYAHLAPGSTKVDVGDEVRTGQQLGLMGNSGASLAPHLHFHIVNGSSVLASDGFPFTFNSFELAAQTDIDALRAALQGEPGFPTRDQMTPTPRADQLPLDFTISDFPGRADRTG
jgi:murein DD-endopeptidase MepM/ murein hydrolase activator NlpD